MAEGLLKKILTKKGSSGVEVHSCGIAAAPGFGPTASTIEVMKEEGINVSGYQSTVLTKELIDKADIILAMEQIHKMEVIRMTPDAKGKTYLLKEFVKNKTGQKGLSVSDPIGGPPDVYKKVLNTIKDAVEKLAEKIL